MRCGHRIYCWQRANWNAAIDLPNSTSPSGPPPFLFLLSNTSATKLFFFFSLVYS